MTTQPGSPNSSGAKDKGAISPESLPVLRSIAPSIFVPLTEDLTAPLPAVPSSTTVHLETAINRHVSHCKAVQANIVNYHRREIFRQSLDRSSPDPPLAVPSNQGGLSDQERAQLVKNLDTPHNLNRDYRLDQAAIPWPKPERLPTREMRQLAQAITDLEGYRKHANAKLEKLKTERNQARDREAS